MLEVYLDAKAFGEERWRLIQVRHLNGMIDEIAMRSHITSPYTLDSGWRYRSR